MLGFLWHYYACMDNSIYDITEWVSCQVSLTQWWWFHCFLFLLFFVLVVSSPLFPPPCSTQKMQEQWEHFFSRVSFLCWLLFRYPFHPHVTTAACEKIRVLLPKCRWQVTAKHTYTLHMRLCMKWHDAWLYGVHRTRRDGSSFMWHQPCQHCKYTTSVDIQKMRYQKAIHSCSITCELSVSVWECINSTI